MTVDFESLLREVGALREGHFLLSSGRHSDRYIEKFDLLADPRATATICEQIAAQFADAGVAVVAGPTTGGILLAFEVARQLGVRAAYAERAANGPGREFRRGAIPQPGERVLVVDDILTTGGSVRETLSALAEYAAVPVAVAVLVDRSGGRVDFGVPLAPVLRTDITTYDPADCPLCRAGVPLVKPGTTVNPGARRT
jgi:orotate phosphoribosyltransferase